MWDLQRCGGRWQSCRAEALPNYTRIRSKVLDRIGSPDRVPVGAELETGASKGTIFRETRPLVLRVDVDGLAAASLDALPL